MSDIIVLDCDSMVYLACYKENSFTKRKAKLIEDIQRVQKSLDADEIYPLFKGVGNFRFDITNTYKGNRDDSKLDEEAIRLKARVRELGEWASEYVGMACHAAEADDYVGILNHKFISEGHSVVMSHIDKDINQIVGRHHNFNKNEVYDVTHEQGYYKLLEQTLTGDAADNIKGLYKVGPKTAEKWLTNEAIDNWWDIVQDAWKKAHPDNWKELLSICANLVYMRTTEEQLKELSWEELERIYTWKPTWGIGQSVLTQEVCQQESSDSSTKLSTEQLADDTSVKSKSTATHSNESQEKSDELKSSKRRSGETTQAVVNRSMQMSNRKARKTLIS